LKSLNASSFCAVSVVALALSPAARATPRVSPPVVVAGASQLFSLVAEPEKGNVVLTTVELFPPADFKVSSFADAEGWHRDWTVQSARNGIVQKAVWTREGKPKGGEALEDATENDAVFSFVARPNVTKAYALDVRETYSDGSVLHWTVPGRTVFPADSAGAEAKTDAPVVVAKDDIGGSSTSTLLYVALGLAALALVVAVAAALRPRFTSP